MSKGLRAAIALGVGFAGGCLCFVLYYLLGVTWEAHRFPGSNLIGLAEFITGIPVALVSGLVISVVAWRRTEPQGPSSVVARGMLAALLGLLTALLSFLIVNAAYISHYYGRTGGEYGAAVAIIVGVLLGLVVFWQASHKLKPSR